MTYSPVPSSVQAFGDADYQLFQQKVQSLVTDIAEIHEYAGKARGSRYRLVEQLVPGILYVIFHRA